jgi:hypothetical protein
MNIASNTGRAAALAAALFALEPLVVLPLHCAPPAPIVEIEEDVYTWTDASNGAGPMWCSGSTCLVRCQDHLFATALETIPNAPPLNNCRWVLLEREAADWRRVRVDEGRTREPSPVAVAASGKLFVSTNPTLGHDAEPNGGPARPDLLEFSVAHPATPPIALAPRWEGVPVFREHSYRTLTADGPAGDLLLFQNIDYTHAKWAFRNRSGEWCARGRLVWPWGADYERPQPIRVCYPTVALRDRAVHFFGVSDIYEPRSDWHAAKEKITGQHWDYDFRKLFYTWTPDITSTAFHPWIEVASREATCGWMSPADLWLAPDGNVHLLWIERAIDERLREKFFPAARQSHSFVHAIVRDGKIVSRETLLQSTEDHPGLIVSTARFQPTPDGRLFIFLYVSGRDTDGRSVAENRLMELQPGGGRPMVRVLMQHPFTGFFNATVRAGSPPSLTLDLLGTCSDKGNTIRYARLRLPPTTK